MFKSSHYRSDFRFLFSMSTGSVFAFILDYHVYVQAIHWSASILLSCKNVHLSVADVAWIILQRLVSWHLVLMLYHASDIRRGVCQGKDFWVVRIPKKSDGIYGPSLRELNSIGCESHGQGTNKRVYLSIPLSCIRGKFSWFTNFLKSWLLK